AQRDRQPGLADAALARSDGDHIAGLAQGAGQANRVGNGRYGVAHAKTLSPNSGVLIPRSWESNKRASETGFKGDSPSATRGEVLTWEKLNWPISAATSMKPRRRAKSSRVAISRLAPSALNISAISAASCTSPPPGSTRMGSAS